MFLILSALITTSLAADQLILAQTLWRHGARTPTGSYPSDPYQESFWGVPWGELTTGGMQQQFEQGQRLRKRYIEDIGLVDRKYSRYETYVRSADTPRCIESAMANMASFYSDSPTYPQNLNGWPSTWTPVPVHSEPHDEDRELEAGGNCPKADALSNAREQQQEFQNFLATKWQLFATINLNAGENFDFVMHTLSHFHGILKVEKEDFNLTMPSWITEDFYNDLVEACLQGEDYLDGAAGFGLGEDVQLLRLSGGFMLKEWVNNINAAVNGTSDIRYRAYSGHDTIERFLMLVLGAKNATIGPGNPDYASVIACELWKKDDGQYYVQFSFAKDSVSDLVPFTSVIGDCSSDLCPLNTFLSYAEKYLPASDKECDLH